MNPTERIQEINTRLEDLAIERKGLQDLLQRRKDDKWSEEGMTDRLRKTILSRFGSAHNIKMAKLILNCQYNGQGYDYNPLLLLLDKDMNDISHDINARDFVPDSDEQQEYYKKTGNTVSSHNSITLRYA